MPLQKSKKICNTEGKYQEKAHVKKNERVKNKITYITIQRIQLLWKR